MKYLPFAVVLIALGVGTLIEGKFSDRWGRASSEKLTAFTERLTKVPKTVGDWVGVDDQMTEQKKKEFELSNCDGFISRTYTNREGQSVNVYLVSGSARHVTIHTPDWCYRGAGFLNEDDPQQYTIDKTTGLPTPPEMLTTIFVKEEPTQSFRIRIFWGFTDDGNWRGPRMPKPTFAGKSAMYKLYMIADVNAHGRSNEDVETSPVLEFARQFLPALQPVLFAEGDAEK
jgi:hypothetical protein